METETNAYHRCSLPKDVHIRDILHSSAPHFHKDTSDTLFSPEVTDDEALLLLTDVGEILWSGARALYTGKRQTASSASTPTLTPSNALASGSVTPRNRAQNLDCLKRDKGECIITGRKKIEGFPVEVAHLFPYSLSNRPTCRNESFWKSIEMFLGKEKTNRLWARVGSENVNSLRNLVTMDKSLHDMFDRGVIQFLPFTHTEPPQSVKLETLETDANTDSPSYLIQIDFRMGHKAGHITTTKGILESESPIFVQHGHRFVIPASKGPEQFPDPVFWRIRTGIYDLLYKFGAAAELPRDKGGNYDPDGGYTMFYHLPDTLEHGADGNLDPKALSAMLLRLNSNV